MEKIQYNPMLFDILKDLTTISKSVIIKKENNNIIARRVDANMTIAYSLKTPIQYFNFPNTNNDIAFFNFIEFYQFFKSFIKPEIFIDNKKIILKENNSKIDYVLSDPESFEKKSPQEPNFGESDISFNLTPKEHDELIKMITLIKPEKARIVGNSKEINIILFNKLHDNSFEKTFTIVNSKENISVDFLILSDTFLHIPPKHEYSVNIKLDGFIKFSLLNSDINLDIFTAKGK